MLINSWVDLRRTRAALGIYSMVLVSGAAWCFAASAQVPRSPAKAPASLSPSTPSTPTLPTIQRQAQPATFVRDLPLRANSVTPAIQTSDDIIANAGAGFPSSPGLAIPPLKITVLLGQESVKLSETMAQVPQWASQYEADSMAFDDTFAAGKGMAGRAFLLRLMSVAVELHPSILSKQAELAANRKGIESAKWQYFPNLSVSTERGANPSGFGTANTKSTTLRLQQTLWAGGRIDTGVWVSQLKTLGAQATVAETQQTIALRVIDAWQTLLTAHGRSLSAQKSLAQLNKLDEMMSRRVAQEVSPRIDADLLKARLLQAQGDQVNFNTAYRSALQKLEQLVGDGINLNQTIDANLLAQALKEGQTRSLSDALYPQFLDALEQHPNLLKLEAEMGVAKAEVELKQAEQWPTVYARVERQFTKNTSTQFGTVSRNADNTAYVGLQWSTGAGLSLLSQVEAAKLRLEGLLNDRETAKRELTERIGNEWRDYLSAAQRVQQNALVRGSQVGLLDSYTRLFVAGRRSWIELLNAVRELAQAEQSVTDVQAQVHAIAIRLRVLAGELPWQN